MVSIDEIFACAGRERIVVPFGNVRDLLRIDIIFSVIVRPRRDRGNYHRLMPVASFTLLVLFAADAEPGQEVCEASFISSFNHSSVGEFGWCLPVSNRHNGLIPIHGRAHFIHLLVVGRVDIGCRRCRLSKSQNARTLISTFVADSIRIQIWVG